jgi:hypothetical protein
VFAAAGAASVPAAGAASVPAAGAAAGAASVVAAAGAASVVASSFFEHPKDTADTISTRANNVFIFILLKLR